MKLEVRKDLITMYEGMVVVDNARVIDYHLQGVDLYLLPEIKYLEMI